MISRHYQISNLNSVPAPLLEQMLDFIEQNSPANHSISEVLFKSKFILTELITNAIKHVAHHSNLTVEINDHCLLLIKTDDGDEIKLHNDVAEHHTGGKVITSDVIHTLYVKHENNQAHFYCEENNDGLTLDSDFPEHFGLLIITKSSDEFYYTHNTQTKINTFTAKINF